MNLLASFLGTGCRRRSFSVVFELVAKFFAWNHPPRETCGTVHRYIGIMIPQNELTLLSYPSAHGSWLSSCLEVLLPRECLICQRPLRRETICFRCKPKLPELRDILETRCECCFEPLSTVQRDQAVWCETCHLFHPNSDSIRFLWDYSGLPRDFIRAMKYRPSITLARVGGHLLRQSLPLLFQEPSWDCIVPIPSSASTYRKRLFHPCAEMASIVALTTSITARALLIHDRRRKPQALLDHATRLRRLHSVFTLKKGFSLEGKRVLLVEDVITTGATISAATYTLKAAGARRVDVIALARTRVWSRFRRKLSDIFHKRAQ